MQIYPVTLKAPKTEPSISIPRLVDTRQHLKPYITFDWEQEALTLQLFLEN